MDISINALGNSYTGYILGFDRPAMCSGNEFCSLVQEQAAQNAEDETDAVVSPTDPGIYAPLTPNTFERRELTKDELNELAAELAEKYDPSNMAREEFDSFLDDLVENGLLSK